MALSFFLLLPRKLWLLWNVRGENNKAWLVLAYFSALSFFLQPQQNARKRERERERENFFSRRWKLLARLLFCFFFHFFTLPKKERGSKGEKLIPVFFSPGETICNIFSLFYLSAEYWTVRWEGKKVFLFDNRNKKTLELQREKKLFYFQWMW